MADDDEDDPDCHDNDYLEFMLYSQLHYETTDGQSDTRTDMQSDKHTETGTSSLDPHLENMLAQSKLVAMAPALDVIPLARHIEQLMHRDTDLRPGTQRPRNKSNQEKCKKKGKTIIIDSDSSESSGVEIVKVEKERKLEKLSVEKICPTRNESKFSSFVMAIDSSESADTSDDVLSDMSGDVSGDVSENIHVHITQHQRVLQRHVAEDKWQINDEDRMAGVVHCRTNPRARKFGGAGLAGRYYRPSSVTCYNCKDIGHLSKDCQKPKKSEICILCGFTGHYFRRCPQALCYNCNQPGHDAKQCSARRQSVYDQCPRCYMHGHRRKQCPDLWRQFHLTTSESPRWPVHGDPKSINKRKSCHNCGSKKHFGFNCNLETMEYHMLPSFSLIAEYDKWKDLQDMFSADNSKSGKTDPIKKAKKKDKLQKVKSKSDHDELKTLTPLSAFMQNELELLDSYVCEQKSKRRKVEGSPDGSTKRKAKDNHIGDAKKFKVNHAPTKKVKDRDTKKFQRDNGSGKKVNTAVSWSDVSGTKVKDGGGRKVKDNYGGGAKVKNNHGGGTKVKDNYGGSRKFKDNYGSDAKVKDNYGGGRKFKDNYGRDAKVNDNYGGGAKVKDNYGGGAKKVKTKKKSRNWDSQFSAFSDTGKPVRNKKRGKRKSQNMQSQGTPSTSGFHISRTVHRMMTK